MCARGSRVGVQRLNADLYAAGKRAYVVNLDPAVANLPYEAHIDVRDTVNYKDVMQQYATLTQRERERGRHKTLSPMRD
jgi:GPN-loop GTPase